jgi:hypothetical protein
MEEPKTRFAVPAVTSIRRPAAARFRSCTPGKRAAVESKAATGVPFVRIVRETGLSLHNVRRVVHR